MSSRPKLFQFLPDDFDAQLARELRAFFHDFYRFGNVSRDFDLTNEAYLTFLRNLVSGSFAIGLVSFLILAIIVIRRCFLHFQSVLSRKIPVHSSMAEILAVVLLTIISISSLSGLLGEAQVDYSAGVIDSAMANTSHLFGEMHHVAVDTATASESIRQLADNLIVTFNESELPQDAFALSIESLRLVHASKELLGATDNLPSNLSLMASEWQSNYFWVKSSTNTVILVVAIACFLSISAIGWSLVGPLRFSIVMLLMVLPVSHTMIGTYLASTILTADFCVDPTTSAMKLFDHNNMMRYYLECDPNTTNGTNPFDPQVIQVKEMIMVTSNLETKLDQFAMTHGEIGMRMRKHFLSPISKLLVQVDRDMCDWNGVQAQCGMIAGGYRHAIASFCEYGMLGFASLWMHQVVLCLMLFSAVVTPVLVFERVQAREDRMEMRYQILAGYEEGDGDRDDDELDDDEYGNLYHSRD